MPAKYRPKDIAPVEETDQINPDNKALLRDPKALHKLSNLQVGLNNGPLKEPSNYVKYEKAPCETVIEGKHNTFIVLGRDRPGKLDGPGYGARGHVKAGAIDIVVGRWSNTDAAKIFNGTPQSSNFVADAARIYLSQKADIDDYFLLPMGSTGKSVARSAIGMKADDIRIMSRNTFKIVTGVDDEVRNGEMNEKKTGVQMIAMDISVLDPTKSTFRGLQPMVKGDNLKDALTKIINDIRKLNGLFTEFMNIQKAFNAKITDHTHLSPFFAKPTSKSFELLPQGISTTLQTYIKIEQGLRAHLGELQRTEDKYLSGFHDKYINSSYHKLN